PIEIVRDFTMPRAETGPFTGTVVDTDGQPVAGAVVEGTYAAAQAQVWFNPMKTDAQGTFRLTRSLDPMAIHAETPDKNRAVISRVDAESTEARSVLRPTASASGRLVAPEGKPLTGIKLSYGIRIHMGPPRTSPFSWFFGGTATTDDQGRFALAGLV